MYTTNAQVRSHIRQLKNFVACNVYLDLSLMMMANKKPLNGTL
jgi:hypothetical protein